MEKTTKKPKLTMFITLLLFAIVPMIILGASLGIYTTIIFNNEISNTMNNYIHSLAESEGIGLYDQGVIEGTEKSLSAENLISYCKGVQVRDVDSSYVYVADANAVMLYHPTESKIGQPVSNSVVKAVCANMAKGTRDETNVVEYDFNGAKKYAGYYVAPDCSFVLVVSADKDEVMQSMDTLAKSSCTMLAIIFILIVTLTVIISRFVSNPLKKTAEALSVMAEGKLNADFTIHSHIRENVELVEASKNLQNVLAESVEAIKDSAESLGGAVVDVDDKTCTNVSSISQITEAINEVAETSQEVARNAQTIAEKAIFLGEDVDKLSDNVSRLKTASEDIGKANEEASSYMVTVMNSSNESVQAVNDISKKIGETNAAVANISACVQMIEDISSQTNLLSLNASIEAARAGEAGRGFAVVAEEIRQLADDSGKSAKEIRTIVESVTLLSDETVSVASKVADIISKEQKFIAETQTKFELLSNSVEASTMEIDQISRMTKELETIKNELTNATSNLGAISEELGASSEEVSASSTSVAEGCTDTQARTQEMRAINEHLNEAVNFFKF
ncbi:MAG: hypothetical protein K6C69_02860 [Lachnospiraceae bacterium]|nr:hypothetical protein [Lachnospiraceae bacterium]